MYTYILVVFLFLPLSSCKTTSGIIPCFPTPDNDYDDDGPYFMNIRQLYNEDLFEAVRRYIKQMPLVEEKMTTTTMSTRPNGLLTCWFLRDSRSYRAIVVTQLYRRCIKRHENYMKGSFRFSYSLYITYFCCYSMLLSLYYIIYTYTL